MLVLDRISRIDERLRCFAEHSQQLVLVFRSGGLHQRFYCSVRRRVSLLLARLAARGQCGSCDDDQYDGCYAHLTSSPLPQRRRPPPRRRPAELRLDRPRLELARVLAPLPAPLNAPELPRDAELPRDEEPRSRDAELPRDEEPKSRVEAVLPPARC